MTTKYTVQQVRDMRIPIDPTLNDVEPTFHDLGAEYIKVTDGVATLNGEDVSEVIKEIFKLLK